MTDAKPARTPRIGVAARALVIHRDHVLLLRGEEPGREYFFLPGGAVQHGESLEDACVREVLEETGVNVRAGRPLYLREFIASRHRRLTQGMPPQHHVLALVYLCEVTGEQSAREPHDLGHFTRDNGAAGVTGLVWVPLTEAAGLDLMPPQLKDELRHGVPKEGPLKFWPET